MKAKKKKRNPTDATTRNVRAAKKRNQSLAAQLKELERRVAAIERTLMGTITYTCNADGKKTVEIEKLKGSPKE